VIKIKHDAKKTKFAYWNWICRFIHSQHPKNLGGEKKLEDVLPI
jgi:hypothetical protein